MQDEDRWFSIEKNIPIGLLNSPIGLVWRSIQGASSIARFFKASQLLMPPILEGQLKIDFKDNGFF
ncbi:hypothetical protein Q4E93_05340 [Flavitalea sp. BT771]|uniref:hypothetical protein n=1 Tax=Flavitalea sp. BT771 TaxID=3063329 RepID=UPI0026E28EF7|nr:hypothetical protein [Flavitalea sp. BT771]MDO6429996.1 hypothetical protein [Flavitalea sp. BT771]MDV6217876.1 hypothetical protein [Flavitalea sp. BT771]